MLKQSHQPYGFRNLLVFQKAETLQLDCRNLTTLFPAGKTMWALADQMDRSARSVKQNVVEGWKRNSTKEYYDFLGFSIGALTELEEDCNDIWRGVYRELMGIKGIMGEMVIPSTPLITPLISTPSTPLRSFIPHFDIEKIPFYPLDQNLPGVVKLKLQCKELNFLLAKLQKSLEEKMKTEKTISGVDLARTDLKQARNENGEMDEILKKSGLRRLENGQYIQEME